MIPVKVQASRDDEEVIWRGQLPQLPPPGDVLNVDSDDRVGSYRVLQSCWNIAGDVLLGVTIQVARIREC